jgi:hypothetical protein
LVRLNNEIDSASQIIADSIVDNLLKEKNIDTSTEEGQRRADIYRDYATADRYREIAEEKANIGVVGANSKNNEDYYTWAIQKYGAENVKNIRRKGAIKLANGTLIDRDVAREAYGSEMADATLTKGAEAYYQAIENSLLNENAKAIFSGK